MEEKMNLSKISVALLALLLAAMAMVPMVSASDLRDQQIKKWQDDHTIIVTKTVTEKYSDSVLTTETNFTGKELTRRFGIDTFTIQSKIKISAEDAKKLDLANDRIISSTSEISGVFTTANDPPLAAGSGYPLWLYAYSGGVYYQTGDPINMIWAGAYLSTIKSEMFEKGWYDYILEDTYYIYDGGWKADDGVADDIARPLGGYHIRLFQLGTGEVVGAAHHDTRAPHSADQYEGAEDYITTFYQDPDDTVWHVYPDNVYLGNSVSSPYSNDYAAYIGYW
jgi:hypothetical protein